MLSLGIGGWKSTDQITLASYVYAAKNDLLTTQTYGNGDEVEFIYHILGRTKTAKNLVERDGGFDLHFLSLEAKENRGSHQFANWWQQLSIGQLH